jgi:mannitol/fructose-specific phosphotransferase system IIA component (Ntr-type)
MHSAANHLIQLQELILIRDEQKVAGGTHHLEQLDNSIRTMTAELHSDVRVQFEKLLKKDRVVIVPVYDGICAACGMRLPISLVQSVRVARDVHMCPNCARLLFYPESAPRRLGKPVRRLDPPKIGISRFTSHTLMIPKLEAETKDDVIKELAGKLQTEEFVDKADRLVEEALRREAMISTGMGHGLAFPHVRGVEGGGLTLALGISHKGVIWNTGENETVKIVFFIVIPTAASAFYLKLLAGLSETFSKPEARKLLMAEKDPEKLWKTLAKITRATIK